VNVSQIIMDLTIHHLSCIEETCLCAYLIFWAFSQFCSSSSIYIDRSKNTISVGTSSSPKNRLRGSGGGVEV